MPDVRQRIAHRPESIPVTAVRTLKRRVARAALAGLAAGLASCSGPPPGADLFPLADGHRWTYEVRTEWEGGKLERQTQVMSSHGPARVQGVEGPTFRRRSDSGVDYWIRRDEAGIQRVAAKSDLDADPKPDPAPRWVLKAPIAVGTNWQAPTTAYLLRRRNEFPPEIRHSHPSLPMAYTIAALDEAVDTRAGRFEHCVRVDGEATVRLFADPVAGWRDLRLTTREWYCPGVGLVKLQRDEPAKSPFLTGGTLTMELVSWQ